MLITFKYGSRSTTQIKQFDIIVCTCSTPDTVSLMCMLQTLMHACLIHAKIVPGVISLFEGSHASAVELMMDRYAPVRNVQLK